MRLAATLLTIALAACGGAGGGGDDDGDDDGTPEPDAGDGTEEDRCRPGAGGPHWLAEGEALAIDVACSTGLEPDGAAFELAELPAGASYDPESGQLSWTPALDQAAVYRLAISVAELDESGEVMIGVADSWDHPDNVPVVDPLAYPLEYGLPVLFISPAPTADEPYVPITVVYGGQALQAEGKWRGASSLEYPKKSYTLKFEDVRFSDPDRDGGFMDKKRIVLTSTFDDNSYLRQWLAFELWSRLEPTIPVQAYDAVVYLDGAYHGLYHLTDHIDDDLMQEVGLSGDGNLYKAVNHDANFRLTDRDGGTKATPHDGYEKKEGMPIEGAPGAFADLDQLVQFVGSSSDSVFAAGIGDRIEIADYEKWWMLVTFIAADDSAGKNSYHYHHTGRWSAVPWDFNASFGQAWTTHRQEAAPADTYEWANNIFERLLADPILGPGMRQRFSDALGEGGPLDLDEVLATIDAYAAEIAPSTRRDWARWEAAYQSFGRWSDRSDWTDPAGETEYLRQWVTARAAAVRDLIAE